MSLYEHDLRQAWSGLAQSLEIENTHASALPLRGAADMYGRLTKSSRGGGGAAADGSAKQCGAGSGHPHGGGVASGAGIYKHGSGAPLSQSFQPLQVTVGYRSVYFPPGGTSRRKGARGGKAAARNDNDKSSTDEHSLYALCRMWHNGGLQLRRRRRGAGGDGAGGEETAAYGNGDVDADVDAGSAEDARGSAPVAASNNMVAEGTNATTEAAAPTQADGIMSADEQANEPPPPATDAEPMTTEQQQQQQREGEEPGLEESGDGGDQVAAECVAPIHPDVAKDAVVDDAGVLAQRHQEEEEQDEDENSAANLLRGHQRAWKRKRKAETDAWRMMAAGSRFVKSSEGEGEGVGGEACAVAE